MEFTSSVIFMEKIEKVLLEEMVDREGQKVAADKIGCHQTAISAAIRKKREIYLDIEDGRVVSGYEVKPALGLTFSKNRKA